jgi:hypothetical protein
MVPFPDSPRYLAFLHLYTILPRATLTQFKLFQGATLIKG